MKKVIHPNSILLLFIALPLFVCLYFAIDSYKKYISPTIFSDNSNYTVCSSTGCQSFQKSLIDNSQTQDNNTYLDQYNKQLKDEYISLVSIAKSSQMMNKQMTTFYSVISLIYFVCIFFIWYLNKITISESTISISTFLAITKRYYRKSFPSQPLISTSFEIAAIKAISIFTTTSLIEKRTDISQINWRDDVIITFANQNGEENLVVVELFVFPKFKQVIQSIYQQNPSIPITFSKISIKNALDVAAQDSLNSRL